MFKPKAVFFDLDGTLVNSVPDLADCIDQMLWQLGRQPVGETQVMAWVGNGLQRLIERALAHTGTREADAEELKQARYLFDACYAQHYARRSHLYPGVLPALDYLYHELQLPLACITNKADAFTQPLLAALDLSPYFKLTLSGDSLAEKKPHPLPLEQAAAAFNLSPAQTLMIGDSRSDVLAARAAGCMGVICTRYGYNHGRPIADEHPDALLDSLEALRHWIS